MTFVKSGSGAGGTLRFMTPPKPFRLLTDEEFARLSSKEKVAYLAQGAQAVAQSAPITGGVSQPDAPADGSIGKVLP